MISKQDILESIKAETNIIKHLAQKATNSQLTYRPSEGQRSLLELMQYLSYCAIGSTQFIITGKRDHMPALKEKSLTITLSNFSRIMDEQFETIELALSSITEESLTQLMVETPTGEKQKASYALMNRTLKFLTAYRMQLFLYLKASGTKELGSANCWAGVDALSK